MSESGANFVLQLVWLEAVDRQITLLLRYTNNAPKAARSFNLARKDGEWGELSLKHLINIYIDPNR